MKSLLLLTIALITQSSSQRLLRKDYYSSKSSKSSGNSSKSGKSVKSSKGSGKSGKSGDAKVAKFYNDENAYGYYSHVDEGSNDADQLVGNSVQVDDWNTVDNGLVSNNVDDWINGQADNADDSNYDDNIVDEMNDEIVDEELKATPSKEDASEDSLQQNSWLIDLIDVTDDVEESLSFSLLTEAELGQNSWVTSVIDGDEPSGVDSDLENDLGVSMSFSIKMEDDKDQSLWMADLIDGSYSTDGLDLADHLDDLEASMSLSLMQADESVENDDLLDQNSWLTDVMGGDESFDDNIASTTYQSSMSLSLKLETDDSLDQNSWLTDFITGNDSTNDEIELEASMSLSLKLEAAQYLPQDNWLTDLIYGDSSENDNLNVSESTGEEFDVDVDLEISSMPNLDADIGFDTFLSMNLGEESMSMSHEDDALSNGGDVGTDDNNIRTDDDMPVGEKDTSGNPHGGGTNNEFNDDQSGTNDAETNSGNGSTDDDGDTDDSRNDISESGGTSSYLTQDERIAIILDKCNTSPLERALSMIQIIGNHIDPQEIISQSSQSPQYLAFLWLVYFDDAILCAPPAASPFDSTFDDSNRFLLDIRGNNSRALRPESSIMNMHTTLDRIMQRFALAMLYFSFEGYAWYNCSSDLNMLDSSNSTSECVNSDGQDLVKFLDKSHECEWFGVACTSNTTADMDVDVYYPVTHLELPSNNLKGYIPEEISLLYTLEVFDLRDNELSGTIPFDAFATMQDLDTIRLSGNNYLSGDATRYCENSTLNGMLLFETDCTPIVEELKPAPVQCSCCTSCT